MMGVKEGVAEQGRASGQQPIPLESNGPTSRPRRLEDR